MPKEEELLSLAKAVSAIQSSVTAMAKSMEDKNHRDSRYFEEIFNTQKEINDSVTRILVRQEGMDEKLIAHYKSDDLRFAALDNVANDVSDLKKDNWKMQGVASFVAFIVSIVSALGISLTIKNGNS